MKMNYERKTVWKCHYLQISPGYFNFLHMSISTNLPKSVGSAHLFSTINFASSSQAVISWWVFPTLLCFLFLFLNLGVSNHCHCIPCVEREPFHTRSLKKSKSYPNLIMVSLHHHPHPEPGVEPGLKVKAPETILSVYSPSQDRAAPRNMELKPASTSSTSKTKNEGHHLSSLGSYLTS